MIFICPAFDKMPTEMMQFHRLYAYPNRPDPPPRGGFVILDSGAWAAHQRKARIDGKHIAALAEHYARYQDEGYICIAPDVYLDPWQTMRNWTAFREQYPALKVTPVIQFDEAKKIDASLALQQARFYAPERPRFLAISNPGLRACQSLPLAPICAEIRMLIPGAWLHALGAGWSGRDVVDWARLGCFDSMDSVAYYTDAKAGKQWRLADAQISIQPWRSIAVQNARFANLVAR